MKNLCSLVAVIFGVSLAFGFSPIDYVIPSLEDFYPSDSGPWYYSHTTIAFIPFPLLPNYKIDVNVIQVPNGKIMKWTAYIGSGTVKGIIMDTTSERYSICELGQPASDMVSHGVIGILTNFCGQLRSLRRVTEGSVMAVVLCPSGSESVYFSREKPSLVNKLLPFGLGK